jgi:ABC-2 type transport system permease protein
LGGFLTLFYKEILRFRKVAFQTVLAPILTAMLYLLIFSHVLEGRVQVYPGVAYSSFLIPGLAMMSLLQNSFANSSSSIAQSKITGNIVFVLLTPLTHIQFYLAYVLASCVRGLLVGAGVLLATSLFVSIPLAQPLWVFVFAFLGAALLGTLGMVAGIWAEKFDQIAAFQNFIIIPLTFLSGVFYSIHSLPEVWQQVSKLNPFFYMIDGFRYGFFGLSDMSPYSSLMIVGGALLALSFATLLLIRRGYKLRA